MSRLGSPGGFALCALITSGLWISLTDARAQNVFDARGQEFALTGDAMGDQVFPQTAIGPAGGYVVWQDNATDEDGWGISAIRLNAGLSAGFGTFRVNSEGRGDQINPQVALLSNGGAVIVWQSADRIKARFLAADGTFVTDDVTVSSYSGAQTTPVAAGLEDGNVVIAWGSFGQDNNQLRERDRQGVFARRFSAAGQPLGVEFLVNQTTVLNQRSPAIAPLAGGRFVIVWISEVFRGVAQAMNEQGQVVTTGGDVYDVDVMGRIYAADGAAQGGERKLNSLPLHSANPSVAATPAGFSVVWSGRSNANLVEASVGSGWDIYQRNFDANGQASVPEQRLNTHTPGAQVGPRVAAMRTEQLVVWTSFGQDGSREGVVGRLLMPDGAPVSGEFRVNTITTGPQFHPAIAANGEEEYLVVWSGYAGTAAGLDLFGQRYSSVASLLPPPVPFVTPSSQTRLTVTWPLVQGYADVTYLVYMNGGSAPVATVKENLWTASSLAPASTHQFRIAYRIAGGQESPLSPAVSGTTWDEDANFDGLPDDWQRKYFGADAAQWPSSRDDSDGDGASNLQEFLAGTHPADAASVLRMTIQATPQGTRLVWNTEPGSIYQVQTSTGLNTWNAAGAARFAAGKTDSVLLTAGSGMELYRIVKIR